ncbi:MAG: metallophosphoesterase [Alphaproteobacteria bacterium]
MILFVCSLTIVPMGHAIGEARAPLTLLAFGDMPCGPADLPAFEALLQAFNDTPHDITLHVGDIKGGGSPCSDEVFTQQRDYLNPVAGPLVYVPGDNEWTDCHRKSAGQYDPLERLAFLRQTFFVPGRSLGQTPLTIEQQAQAGPPFEMMIENARWQQGGVRFVTAHVVGSNNGLNPKDPAAVAEYHVRDDANIVWIGNSFAMARDEQAMAVVLVIHGDPFLQYGIGGGFIRTINAIAEGAAAFGGPVLLIHGDGHEYTIDTPFQTQQGQVLENVFRLEVPGAADMRAVRVRIDPDAPTMFAFEAFGPN